MTKFSRLLTLLALGFLCQGLLVGCTEREEMYSVHTKPVKLADYLFQITYSDYSPTLSTQDALAIEHYSMGGACAAVRSGNLVGRNYDYLYSEMAEFVIRVTSTADRYASIGVAGALFDLTQERAENDPNGQYFDILPYTTLDGINEKGVFCEINMVKGETKYATTGTNPSADETLRYTQVVRFVLDHCSTAAQACEELQKRNIVFSGVLGEFHYLIADSTETYVVEVFDNRLVCRHPKENILTNFYVLTDAFLQNDDAGTQPMGIERYQVARDHLAGLNSVDDMANLMELIKYSRLYDLSNVPYYYSEYYGEEYDGLTIDANTPKDRYFDYIKDYVENFDRSRRSYLDDYWITTHTSVYDLDHLTLRVYAQEDFTNPMTFAL